MSFLNSVYVYVSFTLMDKLIEGMLSISSWFSPYNWPSVVVYTHSLIGNVLSI